MTNKFISFLDGIRQVVASNLGTRCNRSDSVSIVSRQSVLLMIVAFLFIGIGNAWGATATIQGDCWGATSVNPYQTGTTTFTDEQENTWTAKGYGITANTAVIIGKGGANYLETPEFSDDITSIAVTWSGNSSYYLALQTTSGTELEAKSNPSTATEQTFTVSGSYKQLRLVGRRSSGSQNAQATITKVVVTYGSSTPAYTITPASNNTSYGTVELSGSIITGSPKSGCRYATPAYTVTNGTATVSQNGNAFTVTPSSDCTIQINFEEIPSRNINFNISGGSVDPTFASVKEGVTYTDLPDVTGLTTNCEFGTFEGWTEATSISNGAKPEMVTSVTMSTSDVNLNAVYSKTEGGSSATNNVTFSENGYDSGTDMTTSAVAIGTNFASVSFFKGTNGSNMPKYYVDATNGNAVRCYGGNYFTVTANSGNITAITLTYTAGGTQSISADKGTLDNNGSWTGEETSVKFTIGGSSGQRRVASIAVTIGSAGTTTYSLAANCCDPLGQIKGSFNVTSYSASERAFSWANETTVADVDHYELSYKQKNVEGNPTPIANNITNSIHAYTHTANLTEGITYTYYLKAIGASGHCDATEELDVTIPYAQCTVTFDDNGATGGNVPEDITQNTGTDVTVPGNSNNLEKTNYAFGGWNTKDDGTGTNYEENDQFALSSNITLYAKWTCAQKVNVTKGTESNGSFNLSETGEKYTCDGAVVITVSGITPSDGYRFKEITQTGVDANDVTIDQENKTVTYAQYANGASEINVTFEQIPTYQVTWNIKGDESLKTTIQEGSKPSFPTPTPESCSSSSSMFYGWATAAIEGKATDLTGKTVYTTAEAMPEVNAAVTYFAVFAKGTPSTLETLLSETFYNDLENDATQALTQGAEVLGDFSGATDKAFKGAGGTIKFGTGSAAGYITSKELDLSEAFKVSLKAKRYGTSGDGGDINVTVGGTTKSVSSSELTADFKTYTLSFDAATSSSTIKIGTSSKRAYIDDVVVYTGEPASATDFITQCAAVEAPTFSVVAGTYDVVKSIVLSCETEGADIYYTTDGETTPTSSSTKYTEAIAVNQSMTIKAIAIKDAVESSVAEAAYVLKVKTPTINADKTEFFDKATVTLACDDANAKIYYTIGEAAEAEYSEPFEVNATATVTAVAKREGWTDSENASQDFTRLEVLDVAGARDAIDQVTSGQNTEAKYVRGIISSNPTFDSKYNSLTYNISADGESTSDQLKVYSGKSYGGANFSSADDLLMGDEVVVYGTMKLYQSTTYQFNYDNQLVERKQRVLSIALSGDYMTECNEGAEFSHEGMVVTATYNYGDDAVVTANATWSTPDLSTEGAKTVTVSYTFDGKTVTKDYTITVNHVCASEVTITKDEEANGTFALSATGAVCGDGDGAEVEVTDIAPAEGYRFKTITATAGDVDNDLKKVTGIKANATIGVEFEQIPTHQVTWNVNGDETTKTTVQEGSKPVFPATPVSCDDAVDGSKTFIGWATEPWTGKAENLNEKTVYTSAADMDPVTAEGTKYYAVFAKATAGDPVPMTLWSEDFSSYKADDVPEGGSPISYSVTNGGGTTKVYTTQLGAGGDSPELLVAKSNGTFTASGIATNGVSSATLTYHTNQTSNLTVKTTAEHVTIGSVSVDGTDTKLCTRTITFAEGAPETFDLTFTMTTGSNSRLDDIVLSAELSSVSYSEFLTTCCTKYDIALADGGTVVVEEVQQGTFSAEFEKACADTEVKLTASPATKYHFDAWSVSYNDGENDQTVTVNETEVENVKVYSFTMPAFDVTVSATFVHDDCANLVAPTQNGTIEPTYNSATIAWNAVANASSYYVTVTENEETEPIFSANVNNITSKELEGLKASTTYNFSVMAVGDGTDFCAEGNDSLKGSFITIAAPVYTVHFSTGANNPTQADIAEDVRGEGITIPAGPTPVCEGWAFAGWATAAVAPQTTEAPATLYKKDDTYIPNEDNKTLYAVYSTEVASSGNGGSVEITTDTENFPTGYGNANTFTEYTLDGYKFKIQQAYINGGKLQWRASGSNNGTGTIYNTQVYPQKITSVVLVYNSSDGNKNFTLNVGDTENPTSGTAITPEIDGSTYTFNCSAANADYFVLTNGTNAGYLDTITINYGVASVTNYISEPACCTKYDITIATGIENGSVTADLAKACEGVEVTLTPIASASYHLESLSVMNGETPVDVDANNKFNMPAGNVTVSATFVHDDCTNLDAPTLNEVTKDHHSATIAWNAVEGAVSYVLNVTEHNAAAIVTNESVTETSKALSSLKPSTQYDYSIMAVGDGTDKCADGNALLEGNFTTDEPATTGTFELFTGNLTEGDYVITHASANAIKAEINSDRFAALEVSPSEDIITNPDESIIWHIAQSGEYWTIYNVAAEKYAASTGAKNKGALSTDGTDDKALWSLSGTYDFINKQNTANNVNATLRYNSQNALNTSWACYASGTGSTLVLYKKVDASKPSTPTFTVAGGEYESAQTVHIACATEGATIHYTTDGTTPTSESAEFTEDLVISTNTTLQAIAIKGDVSSNVATATYTFIVWKSVDEIWNDITADGPTDARVYGYVSDTTISGYKNNFYISVDGSKEGNQLYAYRMNMNDKTITIGDKVKLRGDLTIYNNVKEFKYTSNTNCGQVISVEPKGDLQSIVVSEAPTKTVYAANEDFEPAGLVVTGTYENGYVGVITEGITWGNDLTENKVTESTTVHVTATVGEVTSPAYEVAVTVATKTLVSIAATPVTYTIYTGEALPQPTIMATYSEGDPEDVSAFATYDSENVFNTETIDNPDPQTITVSYTFGEETQTTTYTVSVKDYANDAENPYTVAEALYIITNAIGNTNSARDIYVQGIVCQKSNPSSKTQTYYISDDGTTTTKLEIYKGKYLAGADFTEDNQVLVNDEVLVGGKVIYYNSNTPEFASGLSQLYSLSRTPNFSIANVTAFEVGAEDKAAVVTKDGNGAVTLASSSDVEVVTIVDNKLHAVAPGMATITANLAASGIYKASQTEFSVEVVAAQAHHILTLKTSGVVYRAIDAFEGTSVWNLLDTVTAPNIAGYNFKGWSLTEAEEVLTEGTAGTLDADMTLYAVYAKGNVTYVKVTETSAITSGQYLIVYEGDNSHDAVAFNGALETLDAASNIINVAIVNEVITGTNSTAAAEFTIDATANTIRSKSGKYIGRTTSGNGMNTSEEATLTNTMSIDADQNFVVKGTGGNIFLMYNSNSGDKRFRYYGGTQKAIQLYKRTDGAESAPVSNPTITVEENEVVNVSDVAAEGVPVSIVVENGGTMNIDQTTIATNITAKDGATINVNEETTAENIVVENGGKIVTNAPTTTPTVYFATTMGAADNNGDFHGIASELGGVTNITLAQGGEIIYDLTLGTSKAGVQADPSHWHAFSLPFEVDALNGIYDAETGLKLTNEVNYAIMDYHGDIRANGDYGWKKYRGTLKPGVFYLMTVDGNTTTFRFKATQAGQMDQTNSMSAKAYDGTGADTDKGWNGFGNPRWIEGAFGHDAQYLDPYTYEYITIIPGMTIPVGLPFFYKASTTSPVQMDEVGTTYAPARSKAYEIKNVAVRFGNEESKDKLYISASEDALNEYEQDKDLVKMFMSQTPNVARISGKAYGMKLAKVYAPMVNDQAEYSLTLYAPQAGEYTISVSEVENADIYLTHEGTIIWNLSMGAYTNDFAKGNTEGYGLLLVKKAPSVATGVDSAEANEAGVQKVIIEDKVFILRGGQMYDVTGKAVR